MLTPKQQRFIAEYLVDLNGTQAAIRAGYSAKTARAIACENLKKPALAAKLRRHSVAKKIRTLTRKLNVWRALERVAYAEIDGIYDDQGRIKHPSEWPREAWDGIKDFEITETPGFDSKGRPCIHHKTKIKLSRDKVKALIYLDKKYAIEYPPEPPTSVIQYTDPRTGKPS